MDSDKDSEVVAAQTSALLPIANDKAVLRSKEKLEADSKWRQYAASSPDRLLEIIYQYYRGGGYQTICLTKSCNLLIFIFLHAFIMYLAYGIEWGRLLRSRNRIIPSYADFACTSPLCVLGKVSMFGWAVNTVVLTGLAWNALSFHLVDRQRLRDAQLIYRHILMVRDRELGRIDFDVVMKRLCRVEPSLTKDRLNEVRVCARVMRRENYLIALFNRKLLDWEYGGWNIPLSKPLEWSLTFCILGYVFDESFMVQRRFLNRHVGDRKALAEGLRRRSRVIGILSLILSPLIFLFTLAYVIFRYGEDVYRNPHSIATRQYSLAARWSSREYNELPHYFEQRMSSTHRKADRYMELFPSVRMAAIARLISFVSGSLFIVLLAIVGISSEETVLHMQMPFGKGVLWWVGGLGAILAVSRSLQPTHPAPADDPSVLFSFLSARLHLRPKTLPAGSRKCFSDFSRLYKYRAVLLLDDLLGTIASTPLVLLVLLPARAELLVDFFREFTVHVDGLGYVCSFSVFNFDDDDGSSVSTAAVAGAATDKKGSGGGGGSKCDVKMEASMMSFAERHLSSRALHQEQPDSSSGEDASDRAPETCRSARSIVANFYNNH